MKTQQLTTEAVRRAAIERLGCADAMVTSYRDSQGKIYIDGGSGQLDSGGYWYVLAVQRRHGEPFDVVGRRRSLGELLAQVESKVSRKARAVA